METEQYSFEKTIEPLIIENNLTSVKATIDKIKGLGQRELELLALRLQEFIISPKTETAIVISGFSLLFNKEKTDETLPRFKIISHNDLMQTEDKPKQKIVTGLINSGEIGLLVGKRANKKSVLALHLAYSIANGLKAFNQFETAKTPVLIIDNENNLCQLKDRAKKLNENLDADVHFLSFPKLKLDNMEDIIELKAVIKALKKENPSILVIIDTFSRFHSLDSENSPEGISSIFMHLREIAVTENASFLILHHLRKGYNKPIDELDEVRGSSDLVNSADFVLSCECARNSSQLILKQLKSRFSQELEPLLIEVEWNDKITLNYKGTCEESILVEMKCANAIKEYVSVSSLLEFKRSAIIERFVGQYSRPTIDRALSMLVNVQGILIKKARGIYEINPTGQITLSSSPI